MANLINLARTRATMVWLALIGATLTSWVLGTGHGLGPHTASVLVLLLALVKARLVGLYFMELRGAPAVLRLAFEAYCAIVLAVVIGLYLAA